METTTILTALGLGGILGVIVKHFLDVRSETTVKLKTINEEKYRTILIYMSIILDPGNKNHFILNDNILASYNDNQTIIDYSKSKLQEYYYQSLLYASDDVLLVFKEFLVNPTRENYIIVARMMRKDLWNKNTKLEVTEI